MDAPLITLDGTGRERFSDAAIGAVRAHPRFGDAIRQCVEGGLALCRRDPKIHRLSRDISRYCLAALTLYLDATGGVSLRRLQDLCERTGLCGRDRAIALFLQLRLMGYVARVANGGDARVRWYASTEGLSTALRSCMRNDLAAACLVAPEGEQALDRFDEPAVFDPFMQCFGDGLLAFARVHQPKYPSLDIFSRRAGGMIIVGTLLLGGRETDSMPPRDRVRISVRGLAQQSRVSRSHVLRLLREAEAVDYFIRDADEGEGIMSAALREEIELYFAILFLSMSRCAHMALN